MRLPIITPAPIVATQTAVFRDLFENKRQYRHFQNYLTGLTVLSNKSMANMARCILDSADKSNLSRFLSESDWSDEKVNDRRIEYLLERTKSVRKKSADSYLPLDDTLCEHVGSLLEYVDRHYNHGENTYPLAHNLVTWSLPGKVDSGKLGRKERKKCQEVIHRTIQRFASKW